MTLNIRLSIISTALAALSAPAHADATEPKVNWEASPYTVDVDRRGSEVEDYTITGWMLTPTDQTKPHIRFSCTDRAGLVAIISPTPELEAEQGTRVSTRRAKTNFKIEGRKRVSSMWVHVRETGILQSRQNEDAKKIFNAVITQSPIDFKLPMSKGNITLQPPKADGAFKTFMQECSL